MRDRGRDKEFLSRSLLAPSPFFDALSPKQRTKATRYDHGFTLLGLAPVSVLDAFFCVFKRGVRGLCWVGGCGWMEGGWVGGRCWEMSDGGGLWEAGYKMGLDEMEEGGRKIKGAWHGGRRILV